jgi:hypothetical protein
VKTDEKKKHNFKIAENNGYKNTQTEIAKLNSLTEM